MKKLNIRDVYSIKGDKIVVYPGLVRDSGEKKCSGIGVQLNDN